MKIGIVTLWESDYNYGQILQCYAMQAFLREMGHDAFHIRHIESRVSILSRVKRLFSIFCRGLLPSYISWRKTAAIISQQWQRQVASQPNETICHKRGFDQFKAKYIKYSEKEYTLDELYSNPPSVDCLIAGSDQIWISPNQLFMLDFGPRDIVRISYAASMGSGDLDRFQNKYLRSEFKRLLKKIDHVTLREQNGVDLCHEIGRKDAELVPDPVLLLDGNHYRKIAVRPKTSRDYVFIYLLGNPSVLGIDQIIDWCEAQGLKYKYVAAQGQIDDYQKEYPNIDEWLGLIDSARYVITNSFHGMVVSILHNKQFIVIPTVQKTGMMDSRFSSTLGLLKLKDRIFANNLDEIKVPIDYTHANNLLETKRQEIKEKFTNWLKD